MFRKSHNLSRGSLTIGIFYCVLIKYMALQSTFSVIRLDALVLAAFPLLRKSTSYSMNLNFSEN